MSSTTKELLMQDRQELRRTMEQDALLGFAAAARKTLYTPSATLLALARLLIKYKTIGKRLGITGEMVSAMVLGKLPSSPKHEPRLREMLRISVSIGKKHCDAAAAGTLLW